MSVKVQRINIDYGRLSLMIILSVIFYNEIVVYFRYYAAWPELEQSPILKVMFVADPQILGNEDQDNAFVSLIAKWDSDRYLYKTFSWATYAYSPDVVVFLGLSFVHSWIFLKKRTKICILIKLQVIC